MRESSLQLNVNVERLSVLLLASLVGIELFFVLIDIVINYGKWLDYGPIRRFCNIAREDGIASWFMTMQTFMAGLVLWFLYWLSRSSSDSTLFYQRGWLILAVFFTYMAVDDGAMIHERLGSTFRLMMEDMQANGGGILASIHDFFPTYTWQLILMPFFSFMGVFILYFLWKALGKGRYLIMVIAALSCMSVAVGLDFIEGMEKDHPYNIYMWIKNTYNLGTYDVYHFGRSLEEFLEMLSISFFFYVFVAQINKVSVSTHLICFKKE
ncbi:MAG: hypothetical protein Q9M22_01015 [Mariprofundaceae bacterium]|nr:hypothetical protein [Mariprofundaceae bacterium]